jgi:hypothetical protein
MGHSLGHRYSQKARELPTNSRTSRMQRRTDEGIVETALKYQIAGFGLVGCVFLFERINTLIRLSLVG